ncbi:MAG TPA: DUF2182 domain-containing protein [Candidatus Limnocylindria bacterium]|nr:DUF2182 domain-containing protein [Candidatus Limnocylindria bacterium]
MTIVVALGWMLAIGSQLSGTAALLHHHALIEDGPPLWIAIPVSLIGWQVMLAAMMLPASLPTIHVVADSLRDAPRWRTQLQFLGAFALAWTTFGLFAFMGDFVLHHIVDATPWLGARPWLIEGGVLGLAGGYQLSPMKRQMLNACRHPTTLLAAGADHPGSLALGMRHGLDCLGSSWALMLLMFAEGFANLWWMAALTAVMVYEATNHHGQRVAIAVGLVLLALSFATIAGGWFAP